MVESFSELKEVHEKIISERNILQSKHDDLLAQRNALDHQSREWQHTLYSTLTSSSWKITRPLRLASKAFKYVLKFGVGR
jgi:hypothetical protein